MFKCILIPTDGSEFCERAIRHGVALAKMLGAKIVGVTVTQPLHTAIPRSMIPANLAGVVHSETEKIAWEHLAALEKAAKAEGVAVEAIRESNDRPWEGIIHAANSKGCDLIVMASHGRSGVAGVLIGSQAQKVLTHSKIPVLVVR